MGGTQGAGGKLGSPLPELPTNSSSASASCSAVISMDVATNSYLRVSQLDSGLGWDKGQQRLPQGITLTGSAGCCFSLCARCGIWAGISLHPRPHLPRLRLLSSWRCTDFNNHNCLRVHFGPCHAGPCSGCHAKNMCLFRAMYKRLRRTLLLGLGDPLHTPEEQVNEDVMLLNLLLGSSGSSSMRASSLPALSVVHWGLGQREEVVGPQVRLLVQQAKYLPAALP